MSIAYTILLVLWLTYVAIHVLVAGWDILCSAMQEFYKYVHGGKED